MTNLPIDFQLQSKFMFNLTDQMIKPQLFVESADDREISIQHFQASIRNSTIFFHSVRKNQTETKIFKDNLVLDLIFHKRKFLKLRGSLDSHVTGL